MANSFINKYNSVISEIFDSSSKDEKFSAFLDDLSKPSRNGDYHSQASIGSKHYTISYLRDVFHARTEKSSTNPFQSLEIEFILSGSSLTSAEKYKLVIEAFEKQFPTFQEFSVDPGYHVLEFPDYVILSNDSLPEEDVDTASYANFVLNLEGDREEETTEEEFLEAKNIITNLLKKYARQMAEGTLSEKTSIGKYIGDLFAALDYGGILTQSKNLLTPSESRLLFSYIKGGLEKILERHKEINMITFQADDRETTRVSLYEKLSLGLARVLGWNAFTERPRSQIPSSHSPRFQRLTKKEPLAANPDFRKTSSGSVLFLITHENLH